MNRQPMLDPKDWDDFRSLAHAALDSAIDDLESLRQRPVWTPTPPEVLARLDAPLPRDGEGLASAIQDFVELIQPYGVGNRHPAFMGWAHGAGTTAGLVAEMLAAGLNLNCGGRNHVGIELERRLAAELAAEFGFPASAGGIFVTGTSQANFIGALAASRAALGPGVRHSGLGDARLCAYASAEAHGCVAQAMDMAGIGRDFLRRIPCDDAGRMRADRLRAAIEADIAAGMRPFLIVATAGTVNFGAFDPLPELADIAEEHKVWLHVDGAFGALAIFSDALRPLLSGIARADSIAFDFHKWAHVPYDAGFILARDGATLRQSFAAPAAYLSRTARGLAAGEVWPCDLGPDLSRGFRALKVWMTLKTYGTRALGAAMEANCATARFLADKVRESDLFRLAAPVPLNIVCFSLPEPEANRQFVEALHLEGVGAPSLTLIDGRPVIRCAIFNHRTTNDDVALFFERAAALARRLASQTDAEMAG